MQDLIRQASERKAKKAKEDAAAAQAAAEAATNAQKAALAQKAAEAAAISAAAERERVAAEADSKPALTDTAPFYMSMSYMTLKKYLKKNGVPAKEVAHACY